MRWAVPTNDSTPASRASAISKPCVWEGQALSGARCSAGAGWCHLHLPGMVCEDITRGCGARSQPLLASEEAEMFNAAGDNTTDIFYSYFFLSG